jgi:hypothetical protein
MPSFSGWKRILTESVAVIASILIAFAIDRAWDAHRQRAELRELLEGLRAELIEDQGLISQSQSQTNEAQGWLSHMYTSSPDEAARIPASDTYVQVYLPYVRGYDVGVATGFLEATINSGKLALIPNADTRAALASVKESKDDLSRLTVELDRMGAQAAMALGEFDGVRRMFADSFPVLDAGTIRRIRSDSRLQGLASARVLFFGGYVYSLNLHVTPAVAEALELVNRDLESLR